jgi:hypothetical protein
MIKISLLLTNILFIFLLVGCTNQQMNKHFEEPERIKTDKELINEKTSEPNKSTEPSLIPVQPKLSTQDQLLNSKSLIEKPNQNSTTLSDKALEEKHYIETPIKDPTLSNQSSEHENEYSPKTLNQNTTKDDTHSEASASQSQTAKTKTSNTQTSSTASKQNKSEKQNYQPAHQSSSSQKDTSNGPQNKRTVEESKDSDSGTKKTKNQNTEEPAKVGPMNEKESRLSTEDIHQEITSGISGEKKLRNNANSSAVNNKDLGHSTMNTNQNGHITHSTSHHDQHPQSELKQDHIHEVKQKKKRHWNMQRMIRSKATN